MVPHFGHTGLMVVVVTASGVCMWEMVKDTNRNTLYQSLHSQGGDVSHPVSLALTSACLHALKPSVTNIPVAYSSAVLKPSTARSAATDSPGFLEGPALRTRQHISYF